MTPDEGSAEPSSAQAGSATTMRRPSGRGRHSRGRRRPRRSGNQPRRMPPPAAAGRRADRRLPPPADAPPPETGEGERSREAERPREPLSPPFQPARVESIGAAIEKVTEVIGDLRDALNDMELVLEYLEDVERRQIADEREIEGLQQRLNSMHRRVDRFSPPQRSPQRPTEESADEGD